MFGATNIVKDGDKEKYVYSGYGIAFGGKGEWSFENDLARNAIIFGADISWLTRADNFKSNFIVLYEGDTFGINGCFGTPEKKVYY